MEAIDSMVQLIFYGNDEPHLPDEFRTQKQTISCTKKVDEDIMQYMVQFI